MGYCMELIKSTITIPKENTIKIMDTLSEHIIINKPNWMWVDKKSVIEYCKENDFENVMEEIRYAVKTNKDNDNLYSIWYFAGEKLGDDDKIFKIIAPFINDGYIEMEGEEGYTWRWVFENGTLKLN